MPNVLVSWLFQNVVMKVIDIQFIGAKCKFNHTTTQNEYTCIPFIVED